MFAVEEFSAGSRYPAAEEIEEDLGERLIVSSVTELPELLFWRSSCGREIVASI